MERLIGIVGIEISIRGPKQRRTNYRARVAQLVEHRAITREFADSNPGRINTQDHKITEEKVLPL